MRKTLIVVVGMILGSVAGALAATLIPTGMDSTTGQFKIASPSDTMTIPDLSGYLLTSAASSTYVPKTLTVNGHDLSGNVTITASDLSLSTEATTGAYTDLIGAPILAAVATSGSYNDLSNKPAIPSVIRTTSSLSLSLVGTGATGTQVSSAKDSTVRLNASTSTTSTIGGPSTSLVTLKICATNSATEGNWTTIAILENDQTITLAIALNSIQITKGQLAADVPAGWYVKLVNSGTGTHSEISISGQQTIYG